MTSPWSPCGVPLQRDSEALVQRSGKPLLCVSHSWVALEELRERALWLDHGELAMDGPVTQVLDACEGRQPKRPE